MQAALGSYADRFQLKVLDGASFSERDSLLVRTRVPVVGVMRATGAIYLSTYGSMGASRNRRRVLLAMSAAGLAATAVEIQTLRRSSLRHALPRLLRDLAETSLSALVAPNYVSTSVSGAGLMTEMGFRAGLPASVLLAPHYAFAFAARRASRQALDAGYLVYLWIGLIGGVGLRRSQSARVRLHADALEAIRIAGQAAGRKAAAFAPIAHVDDGVLFGPTSHECIGNMRTHLDPDPSVHQALTRIVSNETGMNRRSELWAESSSIFLSTSLEIIGFEINRTRIVLADHVTFVPDSESGRGEVLSASQHRELVKKVPQLPIRGTVRVGIRRQRLATRLHLIHDEGVEQVPIRRSASRVARSIDPAAAATLVGTAWAAAQTTRSADSLPRVNALPGVAACSALALYAASTSRREISNHSVLSLLALGAGVVQWAGAAPHSRRFPIRPDGTPRLPLQNALLLPALLLGYTWTSLTMQEKRLTSAMAGAFVAVGGLAIPAPRRWGHLGLNLATATLGAAVGGARFRRLADQDVQKENNDFDDLAQASQSKGAAEGEFDEWQLVRSAVNDARLCLRAGLPESLESRCQRCLDLIDQLALANIERLDQAER